jgi:hypothetical protein
VNLRRPWPFGRVLVVALAALLLGAVVGYLAGIDGWRIRSGSLAEWAAGIGALAAAIVALYIANRDRRDREREKRRETAERVVLTAVARVPLDDDDDPLVAAVVLLVGNYGSLPIAPSFALAQVTTTDGETLTLGGSVVPGSRRLEWTVPGCGELLIVDIPDGERRRSSTIRKVRGAFAFVDPTGRAWIRHEASQLVGLPWSDEVVSLTAEESAAAIGWHRPRPTTVHRQVRSLTDPMPEMRPFSE